MIAGRTGSPAASIPTIVPEYIDGDPVQPGGADTVPGQFAGELPQAGHDVLPPNVGRLLVAVGRGGGRGRIGDRAFAQQAGRRPYGHGPHASGAQVQPDEKWFGHRRRTDSRKDGPLNLEHSRGKNRGAFASKTVCGRLFTLLL